MPYIAAERKFGAGMLAHVMKQRAPASTARTRVQQSNSPAYHLVALVSAERAIRCEYLSLEWAYR